MSGSSATLWRLDCGPNGVDVNAKIYMLLLSLALAACSATGVEGGPPVAAEERVAERRGQSPEERRRLEEKMEALIKLLGDDNYLTREEAGRNLLEAGSAALEKLGEATKSDDIEIAVRAQRLIKKIHLEVTRARIELHRAIWKGDLAAVRRLVGKYESLLEVKSGGKTWLHTAAEAGQAEVAEFFMESGISADVVDDKKRTPLHYAADGDIVRLLAGRGADVSAKDDSGYTPLHFASRIEVIKALVASGADLDIADREGCTALHGIVRVNNLQVCKELCRQGADVNTKNKYGNTPLDTARKLQHKEIAALLQSYDARAGSICRSLVYAIEDGDVKKIKRLLEQGADVNMKDRDGVSLLHHAVRAERLEIMKLLIDKGASVDARDANGRTILRYASDPKIVPFLIEAGCKVNAADNYGETALLAAVVANREELVKLLIAKGADVDAADNLGDTPLHAAAEYGSYETAGLLVAANARVNEENKVGDRPLDLARASYSDERVADLLRKSGAKSHRDSLALLKAVREGDTERTRELVQGDAEVNFRNAYGVTALHLAVARGDAGLVRLVLGNGADVNAANVFGRTPLHEAVFKGYGEVVELLVGAGAELNCRDTFGDTPLDDADEDDRELIRLLRGHGARTAAELEEQKGK